MFIASAWRESWQEGYGLGDLRRDALAGITVGVIAIPLAMALAIANGVPPQYGLYSAIVAGLVIAFFGGSRVNVSGPTSAFVVVLLPITHQFGLGGLLVATVMAGMILIVMGLSRMGQLIQYIPYPVTLGFTSGIAVVIASLQLKDFLGIEVTGSGNGHFFNNMTAILQALPSAHYSDFMIGLLTLLVLIAWQRLKTAIPGHMVALITGTLAAWLASHYIEGFSMATIGSRFSYVIDGVAGQGIPKMAPQWAWPWELPNAQGQPLGFSFELVRALIGPAIAIAMLAAIESLLCAVVADGLLGTKHNPNAELVGQGLGNIIAPFFGGITATSAIARTSANVRLGGRTPIAAIVHALLVLSVVLVLADLFAYIPMATLAALLIMVAWNMSDVSHFMRVIRVAPRSDMAVLLLCFSFTIIFDMVLAVAVGVGIAALLFIRRMSELTGAQWLRPHEHEKLRDLPPHVAVYAINGPLFFGAAEKALSTLGQYNRKVNNIIVDMAAVPMMDMTAIVALETILSKLGKAGIQVIITHLAQHIIDKLQRAGIHAEPGKLVFCANFAEATSKLKAT